MATVIDALLITLGLDASKFKAGAQGARDDLKKTSEAADKSRKEFEKSAKRSAEAFVALRREIIGMFAAFTAGVGLKDFIAQTVESDAQVGRLAKNLGVSTEQLSAWEGVLRRSGGSAQDADAGLQSLVSSFEQIQLTGQSPLIPYLNLLKVNLNDLKNPSETLLKISDAFSKMDPRQAAEIGRGMGMSPAMISLLERGRAAVSKMLAEQAKIRTVSQQDAQAAQRLQDTLSSLKQAFTGVGNAVLTALEPVLNGLAQGLAFVGELAQRNKPIVVGLFVALAAAALAVTLPLAAVAAETLLTIAPFLAVGLAVGVVIEAVMAAIRWFQGLVAKNKELRDTLHEVGASASALWQTLKQAFAPVAALFHPVLDVLRQIGAAIADAFGGASLAIARHFVDFLTGQFHVLSDIIRAVTALLHGDLRGAFAAAKDFGKDEVGAWTGQAPRASAGGPAAPGASAPAGGSAAQAAAKMIAGFERFAGHAYWDRNAYRTGYGSDTVTDPVTGKVTKVTARTTVTQAAAQADLTRRVGTEFMPRVAAAVGGAWARLSTAAKAALTSIAYNYGSLPRDVLQAARTASPEAIAAAIRAHAMDKAKNDATGATRGINAKRRYAEAAAVLSGAAPANSNAPLRLATVNGSAVTAQARYAAPGGVAGGGASSSSSSVSVSVGHVTVNTAATDAKGVARDFAGELRRQVAVTQANSGLG